MRSCSIAVVGATGAVGRVFLRILEERQFPVDSIRLCASARSAGKRIPFRGEEMIVEETTPDSFKGTDIAFISATSAVSRSMAPLAVEAGALVIDDSSVWRQEPHVPLVVPEVNGDDLAHHHGIVSIPNCSTTPLVMVLAALQQASPIRRVIADTYQSVSGTGAAAMRELEEQSRQVLQGGQPRAEQYPHQIAFNLLPHIDSFLDSGYTREEWKMVEETRKIMRLPDLAVSATCVRVPVQVSHSEAVHVEFAEPISPAEARELLSAFPGICVVDNPQANEYPMPLDATGRDEVLVGRIRRDASHPNGLALWLVSDNLRKGAATNAIQIAEEVLRRDLLAGQRV